jgi:hypothetical protein
VRPAKPGKLAFNAHDRRRHLGEVVQLLAGISLAMVVACAGGFGRELLNGIQVGANKRILKGIQQACESVQRIECSCGEIKRLHGVQARFRNAEQGAKQVGMTDFFSQRGLDVINIPRVS